MFCLDNAHPCLILTDAHFVLKLIFSYTFIQIYNYFIEYIDLLQIEIKNIYLYLKINVYFINCQNDKLFMP